MSWEKNVPYLGAQTFGANRISEHGARLFPLVGAHSRSSPTFLQLQYSSYSYSNMKRLRSIWSCFTSAPEKCKSQARDSQDAEDQRRDCGTALLLLLRKSAHGDSSGSCGSCWPS